MIVSQHKTLNKRDLILRLQAVRKSLIHKNIEKTISRMIDLSSNGIKSDEIKRGLKILEDEEFPFQLVKRLYSQPAQLQGVYGIIV